MNYSINCLIIDHDCLINSISKGCGCSGEDGGRGVGVDVVVAVDVNLVFN